MKKHFALRKGDDFVIRGAENALLVGVHQLPEIVRLLLRAEIFVKLEIMDGDDLADKDQILQFVSEIVLHAQRIT